MLEQGVHGYPIEIQSLFFLALKCSRLLLIQDNEGKDFTERIDKRLNALSYHLRSYYWLDFGRLNTIYRYTTEEYSKTAANKFNIIPESLPSWIFDFLPPNGGGFLSETLLQARWI